MRPNVNGAVIALVGLCALAGACAPAPPPDTRAADARAVKDLDAAWSKEAAAKDVDRWASYFAEDVAVLVPNEAIMHGREAVKPMLKQMVADPNFAISWQPTQAEASKGGDFVYTVGTYSMTMSDPKDKKPVTDKGKYLTIFRKQADGSWKVVADMFNSDMPPPGSPPQ
jgi:uncharacterized protein (TIGR02246 family)